MASKKTEKKAQEKVIQDRTFGLKNKNKSKAVQNFCKGVANVVKNQGQSIARLESEQFELNKRTKQDQEEKQMLDSIFRTIESVNQAQELDEEEEEKDPKTILCAYHKQGLCQKGKKCKFSHDMSLEQKTEVLDVYTDQREQLGDDEADNCATWDEKTLRDVVEANQKRYHTQKPTEIVCKFFLDALEKGKYGWRWVCPNGMTCHYRHCLPQGFVLKKNTQLEKQEEGLLEDEIDDQREKLKAGGTKISKDVFMKWKADRLKRKEQDKSKIEVEAKKKSAKGQNHNLSGRALFQYDPSVFVDDDEAAEGQVYEEREEVPEEDEEDDEHHYSNDNDEQSTQFSFQQIEEQPIKEDQEVTEEENQQLEKVEIEPQKEIKKKKKKINKNDGVKINDQLFQDDDE